MDIITERTYPTPYANSVILPLLLLSLSSQRITPKVTKNIDTEYDYIIVGGGTAGSVVANRITELPCVNVLLLEAGKDPPLLTDVPALSKFFKFTDIDWNYKTVPQKHTGEALLNKQIPLSNGKTLGGSSIISSMVATRGNPLDYEDWANGGADGWSYEDVVSYFKKLEDNKDPEYIKNGFHNTGGLLTMHRPRYQSEVKKPIFQAARTIGYKIVDPNALKQTGFYDFQASLRKSQRCSVSKAYLVPAENRTNLHILSNAMVRKIVIQNGVASGVLYDYEGETIEMKARREVILSAGTFNTAQLLMLSGIGPKKHLDELKIPVIADLPVGENLQDHCAVPLHFVLNSSIPSILMKLINPANVDQYIKTRNGVLSSADFITALGFQNGYEQVTNKNSPNFQIQISEDTTVIAKLHYGLNPEIFSQVFSKYENKAYITCLSVTLRPHSRGTVKLRSTNPYDPPLIDPNYLEHPNDVKDLVEGLKTCMNLERTPAMQRLQTIPFETAYPGCLEYKKKEEMYFWCLAKQIIISMNNAVGTAKMGSIQDTTTVVDSKLRVKHVKSLRVIDASVMPTITSGDTSIPTIMIAERASDILKSTVDCDELIAESDVQPSIPIISISSDHFEDLPKLLNSPLQRRSDSNLALEQLKEVFSLYNRDKEAYHRSVTDKLQSRIKDLSYALDDLTQDNRRVRSSSASSVDELIRCLEEVRHHLQHQRTAENPNSFSSNRGNSDMLVNQILMALNSVRKNNYPSQSRNIPLRDELPPIVINQILSVLELMKENRDGSETSARRSVAQNTQTIPTDAINQLLSVLNSPTRGEMQPQVQFTDTGSRNDGNNQNILLNQVLSTLQTTPQDNNPHAPNQKENNSANNVTQINLIQDQLNQILRSIDELRQAPEVSQNETLPSRNVTENAIDKTQEMMSQILSAINDMRSSSQTNITEITTTTTPRSNDSPQDAVLNQILRELSEIRQNNQPVTHNQNNTSTLNANQENSSDRTLTQIISSINELKQDIKVAKSFNFQNIQDPIQKESVAYLSEQSNRRQSTTTPIIETLLLQQPQSVPQQVNNLNTILPPVAMQSGVNGLPIGSQPVNPYLNLLQGQQTFDIISQLLGRNRGLAHPPIPPPPIMGMPPGVLPNRMPFPPPFIPPGIPPGMPPNPCPSNVVLNNINLCNGSTNLQRPLTPREVELCQSLHAATQCQNTNNCRSIPPHLYNYYCSGK